MKARRPVSTVRDFRPPGAGAARTTGAPDGATRGGSLPAAPPGSHAGVVAAYPDALLQSLYEDLRRRNLRDYSDHETRWLAGRQSAVAAERKRRGLGGRTRKGATP